MLEEHQITIIEVIRTNLKCNHHPSTSSSHHFAPFFRFCFHPAVFHPPPPPPIPRHNRSYYLLFLCFTASLSPSKSFPLTLSHPLSLSSLSLFCSLSTYFFSSLPFLSLCTFSSLSVMLPCPPSSPCPMLSLSNLLLPYFTLIVFMFSFKILFRPAGSSCFLFFFS